jgi:Immunoglobulin-like domain of bacterial spore germination/Sporulation and spore germination
MTDFEQDPMDDLVRRALTREAEGVRPDPDGLYKIRARIDAAGPRHRRPWLWTTTGAGVAAAAAVGVFALANGNPVDQGGPSVANAPTSTLSTPADATASSTTSPATTPTAPEPTAVQRTVKPPPPTVQPGRGVSAVPVYWLGQAVGKPDSEMRLYRSFVQVKGDPALGAVTTMTSGKPDDPDYTSPWTGARPLSVVRGTGLITVDFGALPTRQLDPKDSGTAVQQLVYTVQGALQSTEPVKVTLKGGPAGALFGNADSSAPFQRAAPVDVQAWIWITAPAEAATANSPLTVSGVASTFEATVHWRIRDLDSGKAVREGNVNASAGTGEFGTFSFQVQLPHGKYQIECLEYSSEDGHEINTDTKTIVVR